MNRYAFINDKIYLRPYTSLFCGYCGGDYSVPTSECIRNGIDHKDTPTGLTLLWDGLEYMKNYPPPNNPK